MPCLAKHLESAGGGRNTIGTLAPRGEVERRDAPRTVWEPTAADPLQHTGWSGTPAGTQNFAIHTPAHDRGGDHEDGQRQGHFPRDNGEIHFTRNKEKGLEKFDGKTAEFKP